MPWYTVKAPLHKFRGNPLPARGDSNHISVAGVTWSGTVRISTTGGPVRGAAL
jgi:hypothetical protein